MLIAMGQMESKLGIPPLRDIGTCKQKVASEYLLYFENSAYQVNNVIDVYIQSSKSVFFAWYY
jgi:hypothetical protein